ncbi:MAG: Protein-glutamine gamma-glutamyltransferase [Syntrophorhabdus sp. PtaU1.Bin050]|nr:MAG: Protein-glutamine gamma-glutamyltransferase [Syntrophorhabdus sp. PtaU1.Bin050]
MRKIEYPFVYISVFFLQISAIFVALGARGSALYNAPGMVFWSVFYGIGLICGWFYRRNSSVVIRVISYVLLVASILLAVITARGTNWQMMFVIFLLFMQAARNFTLSNQRDLYFAYVVSLTLVIHAASAGTGMYLVFYLIVYVLAGMYALLAAYMDSVLSGASGGDRALLLQKIRLPVRGGGLTVLTLLLACLVYVVLPRFPSPQIGNFPDRQGWHRPEKDPRGGDMKEGENKGGGAQGGSGGGEMAPGKPKDGKGGSGKDGEAYSGFTNRFDIAIGKPRSRDVVFYLKTKNPLYARGKVFDTFDGRYWTRRGADSASLYSQRGEFLLRGSGTIGVPQVYIIKKDMPAVVFTGYKPIALWFPAITLDIDQDRGVSSPGPLWSGTVYSVESDMWRINEERPCGGRERPEGLWRHTQIPVGLLSELRNLGRSIARWYHSEYDKAEAIESYLRSNYRHVDTMEKTKDGDNKLHTFLFKQKKGTAEYFATSMALLLRSVQIPSRVVTGYRVTRYNPLLNSYEAQQRDVHVWVEAYLGEYGWTTFEPTPKYSKTPKRSAYFILPFIMYHLNKKLESAIEKKQKAWWVQWLKLIKDILKKIRDFAKMVWTEMRLMGSSIWHWFIGRGWIVLIVVAAAVLAIPLIYPLALLYLKKWMLWRLRARDPFRFIHECYREVERIFSTRGMPRRPYTSTEEHRTLLADRFRSLAPDIDTIILSFNGVRYGGIAVNPGDAERVYSAYMAILKSVPSAQPYLS